MIGPSKRADVRRVSQMCLFQSFAGGLSSHLPMTGTGKPTLVGQARLSVSLKKFFQNHSISVGVYKFELSYRKIRL